MNISSKNKGDIDFFRKNTEKIHCQDTSITRNVQEMMNTGTGISETKNKLGLKKKSYVERSVLYSYMICDMI